MKSIFDIDNESGLTAALETYCEKNGLPFACANELLAECYGHIAWLSEFIRQWEKVQGANDKILQEMQAQGFKREQGGGGCFILSQYYASGGFVWITCLDGGGLPETDNWHVCAYGDDIGDIIYEIRSDYNKGTMSLEQAACIALDVANDFAPHCKNSHRDSGRGVCIDCGAFL